MTARESTMRVLDQNDLVIVGEGMKLFECLSQVLYQTTCFEEQLRAMCMQEFKKLDHNEDNIDMIHDYILQQDQHEFDFQNLELMSALFKVKIEMYQNDEYLSSTILNRGYDRCLRILRQDGMFFEVQSQKYNDKFKKIKKIVSRICNRIIHDLVSQDFTKKRSSSITKQPTLNVQFQGFLHQTLSAQPKIPQQQGLPLIVSHFPRQPDNSILRPQDSIQPQKQSPATYKPITPIDPKQTRVFNYNQDHKISEQIKEEQDETKFLSDIMKSTTPALQIQPQGQRTTGRLKFFNEAKMFGFFIEDGTKEDIFVHLDDMQKSHVDADVYKKLRKGYEMYFSFQKILYQGKSKQAQKAIDIRLERIDPPGKS